MGHENLTTSLLQEGTLAILSKHLGPDAVNPFTVEQPTSSLRETLEAEGCDLEAVKTDTELATWITENGEQVKKALDEAQLKQKARADKYHIEPKEGGSVTMPSKWKAAGATDEDFLDPVNYAYPCHDVDHTRSAASYWGQADNRAKYSESEQTVIDERLAAKRKKFGIGDTQAKAYTIEERAALCGIAVKDSGAEPAEGLEGIKDVPEAWADFTNLRFPLTPDHLPESLKAIMQASDYGLDERLILFTRAWNAERGVQAEQVKAMQAALEQKAGVARPDGTPTGINPGEGIEVESYGTLPVAGDEDPSPMAEKRRRVGSAALRFLDALDEIEDAEVAKDLAGEFATVAIMTLDDRDPEQIKAAAPSMVDGDGDAPDAEGSKDAGMDHLKAMHSLIKRRGFAGCSPIMASDGGSSGPSGGPAVLAGGEKSLTTNGSPGGLSSADANGVMTDQALLQRLDALSAEVTRLKADSGTSSDLTRGNEELAQVRERAEEAEDQLQITRSQIEDLKGALDLKTAEVEQIKAATPEPPAPSRKAKVMAVPPPSEGSKPFKIDPGDEFA